MPSLSAYNNRMSHLGTTIGNAYKVQSDILMDLMWQNDIQSKKCYIYDYAHDDQPEKCYGMTYENTTKTAIDAKFIVTKYGSPDKDQVEYHLQFRPTQKMEFQKDEELYYFEKNYRQKYGVIDTFIGMFIDIPDDMGMYRKWLICNKEIANQFVKYYILPVTYRLMWVEKCDSQIVRRKMWGVLRKENPSKTQSGSYFVSENNKNVIWLPLNDITERLWYVDEQNKNIRLVVSIPSEHPSVWQITNIENTQPIGIQKIHCEKATFNPQTDYIEKDSQGNIIGMWADYYASKIEPKDEADPAAVTPYATITTTSSSIKIGGSYKTLTLNLANIDNGSKIEDISTLDCNWSYSINNEDVASKIIQSKSGIENNQVKIKMPNNRDYIGELLQIVCTCNYKNTSFEASVELEITS